MRYSKDAPIYTIDGYFRRFYELVQESKDTKQVDIYHMLESELFELHKVSMYATANAFRSAKSRYYNQKFGYSRKKAKHEQ